MKTLHIPVVLGTARKSRKSEQVANLVMRLVSQRDASQSELVDVKDHIQEAVTVPPWGEGGTETNATKWKEIVDRADALVLVVPEYNHGYPGELKLLLDSLHSEYKGMPVGIVGVSSGILGGARVIDHIKPVLIEMYLHPIHTSVNFMSVGKAFNEDGTLANEKVSEYISKMLSELEETAELLTPLREKQNE